MKTELAALTKTAFTLCFVLLFQSARVEAAAARPNAATAYEANSFQAQNLQQAAADVAKATGGQGKLARQPVGMHFQPAGIFAEVCNGAAGYGDTHHMGEVSCPGIEKAPSDQGWQWRHAVPRLSHNSEPRHVIATIAGFKGGVRMRVYHPASAAMPALTELLAATQER